MYKIHTPLKCHSLFAVLMAFFAFMSVNLAQPFNTSSENLEVVGKIDDGQTHASSLVCEFVCPDDILLAASFGKCSQEAIWTPPTLGADCSGYSIVSSSHDTGDTFPTGVTTVTYTASDGVTDVTCSFTVTVVDNESPRLSCPANITVSSDPSTCEAAVSWATPVVDDNCAGAMITSSTHNPGDIFPLGFTDVTYTATDAYGNTATCTFYVHIIDVTDPQIVCPQDITVANDAGACGANVMWQEPSPVDNCSGVSVATATHNPGDFFPVGTTIVTYDVVDAAGNTTSCSFNVTVEDNEDPVLTCPADMTISTSPGTCQGGTATWTIPSVTDNCTGAAISSSTHMSGDFFPLGTTTVTYTAIDGAGNTTICSFDVTVADLEDPVLTCPADISIVVDRGECEAVANWSIPVPMDNCDGVSLTSSSHTPGTTFPVGTTTVSYTATDAAGNTSTCSFDVTVVDNEAPELICPINVKVLASSSCNAVANWTVPALGAGLSDNCPGATITTASHTPGETFPIGSTTVTYTATDASGNTTSCSFEVLVADTQSPAVLCPLDLIVSTDPGTCEAVVTWDLPEFQDNCPGTSITMASHTPGDTFPLGTTTVSYEVTDASGNMATCDFDITVEDNEPPVVICPADLVLSTVAGTCEAFATWTTPVPTDNCPGVAITGSTHLSGDSFPLGTTTVTYTATDAAGNTTTCDFDITVEDNEPPVLVCPDDFTVYTTLGSCDAPAEWDIPVLGAGLSDNCPGGMVTSASHTPGDIFPIGITTVTYTATDAAGNTVTCDFDITVEECPATGAVETETLVSDQDLFVGAMDTESFADNGTYLFADPGTPAGATLSNITLQLFFRVNGNSCESDIEVELTDPAGNVNVFSNIFNTCGGAGPLYQDIITVPSASAAGGGNWVVRFRDTNDQNPSAEEYTVRFGRIIYDWQTGSGSCADPIIVNCPADVTMTAEPGLCGSTVNIPMPQYGVDFTDCFDATISNDYTGTADGSAFYPVGTTIVTWTVTDAQGNTTSCLQTIVITDDEAPMITCPADIVVGNTPGLCGAIVNWQTPPEYTDNCLLATITSTHNSGDTFPLGTTTVTYTVTDPAGNTVSCSFDVTVTDTEAPVLVCPTDVLVYTSPGACDAPATWIAPTLGAGLSDNCPGATITSESHASGSTFPIGTTTVTYTATDAAGNTVSCSFDVVVEECAGTGVTETVTLISDLDVFIGGSDTESFADNAPYLFTDPATPAGAALSNITLQLFFRVAGNSCESDIEIQVTDPAGNVSTFSNLFTGCMGAAGGLYNKTITIPSASTTGSADDWVVEFRDTNDQNPGADEYTVRFGRIIYDATTGASGCADPIIVNCPADMSAVSQSDICGAFIDIPIPQYGIDFTDCFNATIINDFTGTANSSGLYPVGTTLVTWTVTDEQGNTTSCIQTITVTDETDPIITCPADIVVSTTEGTCDAAVTWDAPVYSDNCPGAMISSDVAPGSTFPLGTTVVTYTVTDLSGNTVTCSFNVTVEDTVAPVLTCPENVIAFTTQGTCDAAATWDEPTLTDNCMGASITSASHTSGATFPIGITTVTYTAVDAAGNTSECSFDVEVKECEGTGVTETITLISDQDVFVGGADTETFGDNLPYIFADPSPTGSSISNITLQLFFRVNGSSCESDIEVQITDPAGNPNVYSGLFPSCNGPAGGLYSTTITVPSASTVAGGSWIVEFRDNNDQNAGADEYTVRFGRIVYEAMTGEDGCAIPIIVSCPAPVNAVSQDDICGAFVDIPEPIYGVDFTDCFNATIINDFTGTADASGLYPVGTTLVTWTVTDEQGNQTSCLQVVTVVDNTPPLITCPADIIMNTDAGVCTALVAWAEPAYSDNCPGPVITSSVASGTVFPIGTTTVTYSVTDLGGNTTTCSFDVTVEDNEAPELTCPADVLVYTKQGSCDASATWTEPTLTDNCTGASITGSSHTSGTTFPIGTTTITYTAVDAAGNTSECSFDVVVEECIGTATTETVTIISDKDVFVGENDTETFADNSVYTFTDPATSASATLSNITLQLFFRVAGASCESEIEIQVTDPAGNSNVFNNLFATCNGPGQLFVTTVNIPSGSTIGTPADWIVEFRDTNDQNTGVEEYTVRFGRLIYDATSTGTGGCADPVIVNCPADITIDGLGADCSTQVDVPEPMFGTDFTDCFNATISNDYTGTSNGSSLYPVGTTYVTWTVTDAQGNTATCLQTIVITDTGNPVVTCPNDVNAVTDPGVCGANVTWTPPVTDDNCGAIIVSNTHEPGDFFPVGTTTVTYVIADAAGNQTTCSFDITVADDEVPVVTCPDNVIVSFDAGSCDAVATWGAATITDNCAGATVTSSSHSSGDTFPLGTTEVTIEVTDAAGNIATCSFDVTVRDNEPPTLITCPPDVTVDGPPGECEASVTIPVPMFGTDFTDCQGTTTASNSYNGSSNASDTYSVGTTVITWTFTDPSGNTVACEQSVTVNEQNLETDAILVTDKDVFVGANNDNAGYAGSDSILIFDPGVPANATVNTVILDFFFRPQGNSCERDVVIEVTDPAGTVFPPFTAPTTTCTGNDAIFQFVLPAASVPTAASGGGNWKLRFIDTDDQNPVSAGPVDGVPPGTEYSVRFGRITYDIVIDPDCDTAVPCASGGIISAFNETTICVGDGNPDVLNFTRTSQLGASDGWLLVDQATGQILSPGVVGAGLNQFVSPDLDGAGVGVCTVYSISWNGTLSNADMGDNIADIMASDCYALSNPVNITREDCPLIIEDESGIFETTTTVLTHEIKLYPVPTTSMLNIDFTADSNDKLFIQIIDNSGRVLKMIEETTNEGLNTYTIDVNDLLGGLYYVKVVDSKGVIQAKPFTKLTP